MEKLHNFLEHPITNVVTALILIAASLAEGWGSLIDDLTACNFGVHHGVLVFGVIMLLKGVVEALETISRAHRKLK